MTDALTVGLARALGQLLVSIECSNAEDIDPSIASNLIEDVSFVLDELSTAERASLGQLFRQIAEQELHPDNQEALRRLPASLRLD
jgi:hypothetical protein